MGNKVGTYIEQYKSRRRHAADEERRKRLEHAQRHPVIIDPSYELFGYKAPLYTQSAQDPFTVETNNPLYASPEDDWQLHTRRSQTMPESYQFTPYCEVIPNSSVSSTESSSNHKLHRSQCRMPLQPQPQTHLAKKMSEPYLETVSDHLPRAQASYDCDLRRHSDHTTKQRGVYPHALFTNMEEPTDLGATLSGPFSLSEPLDMYLSDTLCLTPIDPTTKVFNSIEDINNFDAQR